MRKSDSNQGKIFSLSILLMNSVHRHYYKVLHDLYNTCKHRKIKRERKEITFFFQRHANSFLLYRLFELFSLISTLFRFVIV